DGVIKGKKSLNVPDVSIKLASVTAKDREFIIWAIENDLDFVAHSFVRNKSDLMEVNNILKEYNSHLKIISKIENREGVDNIDEILENCYGIMVARGDLGVEIEAEKIPVIQRSIIKKCHARKKPVIIATQMLHTMIDNPRPTRAEVSDVANAIFQSTDAIMLSGETANGKYPLEAVRTMTDIALEIEQNIRPYVELKIKDVTWPTAEVLARTLVYATCHLPLKAIVIDTMTGRTGRYVSAFRPNVPIYAKCYKPYVMRELALSFGVYSYFMSPAPSKDDFVKEAAQTLLNDKRVCKEDMIGVLAGSFGVQAGASFIEVSTVKNMVS
ncbi:MAG: pyruvate kinase, partial [Bacteroidales bacterium]|nr:pyruvate kinase [Bacteroidales bacterium]